MIKAAYLYLLHEIETALAGGRTLRQGLPLILERLMVTLRAEGLSLSYRPGLPMLELPMRFGAAGLLLPEDDPLLEAAEVQVMPALLQDDPSLPEQCGALLLARLMQGEETVGVLQLANAQPGEWGEAEQQLCYLIASQLSVALQNGALLWQRQQQETPLVWSDTFGDSLLNLLSTLQIEQVVERIMLATKKLLNVEEASILLRDQESDSLVLWDHVPLSREFDLRLKPGQGIAGWVYLHGRAALVNDVRQDPRWEPEVDQQNSGFSTQSLVAVPIQLEGQTVGVLEAVNKLAGEFDDSDEMTLHTLAKWAGIAITNANTYTDLQRQLGVVAQLSVKTLGAFEIRRNGQLIADYQHPLAERLIRILLTEGARPLPLAEIAARLGLPEGQQEGSSLEKVLRAACLALEPGLRHIDESAYLRRQGPGYCFDFSPHVTADFRQLELILGEGQQHEADHAPLLAIAAYEEALALYQGEYLPQNRSDHWTLEMRSRLQSLYVQILHRLADLYAQHQRLAEAISTALLAIQQDAYNEASYRRLMRYYACDGQAAAALRLYQTLEKLLKEFFGEEPLAATRQLHAAIRAGEKVACVEEPPL